MIRAAIALTAILLTGTFAHAEEPRDESRTGAGFFAEPMVTYNLGSKTTTNWPTPFSDSTGSINGLGVGARVGMHLAEIFFVGADGRYLMPKFKDSSVNYDASATAYNWGVTGGLQTPIAGLRVWGTYIFDGQVDPERSGNIDVKLTKGKGYRIGVGMYVSVVSLNLEYQDLKYDNLNVESIAGVGANANFNSISTEDKAWIASVSFPIAL